MAIRLRAAALVAVPLAAAVLCLSDCAASVDGNPIGTAAGATPSARTASNTSAEPTPAAPSSVAAPTTSASAAAAPTASSQVAAPSVCPSGSPASIAGCLRTSLSNFWSAQLNEAVTEPVVLSPVRSRVPAPCRPAIDVAPAFTCRANQTLYITAPFLRLIQHYFAGARLTYALAAVQAHEMGHIVQYAVHQPQLELQNPTGAQSRFLEQQADCLSGVWAHDEAAAGRIDAAEFQVVALQLISLISTNAEIHTHGAPLQRGAAIGRALASGRPQSCQLATFH